MGKVVKIKDFLSKRHQQNLKDLVKEIDQQIEQAYKEGVPENHVQIKIV